MITLNDYLYSGDTVLRILHKYTADLKENSIKTDNAIDMVHANFLLQVTELLEHNEFLTAQSQRIRKFYQHMAHQYPYLAFTFKGRIKSLIRAEQKFNGYVVEYIHNYYLQHGTYPTVPMLKEKLQLFRDLIAYRIVIALPQCHLKEGDNRTEIEHKLLYEIATQLVSFMEEQGFSAEISGNDSKSTLLSDELRPYVRDYVDQPSPYGYQSLHITFYDIQTRCFIEVQLRTKEMDDIAEIGPANHLGYEKRQETERKRRADIPVGECIYFDEAYERGIKLLNLDLAKLDVNMFAAMNNALINDSCGLFRGRLILPYEHLSRFQIDED